MMEAGLDQSKIPVAINPSGAPPNFGPNAESLESTFLGVSITLVIFATILVLIRLIANFKHVRKLQLDDIICVVAFVAAIGYWSLLTTIIADGSGRHAWDVPRSIFTTSYVKRLLAQQILGNFALFAVKACILSLYIRVFDSVRWLRFTAYGLIFTLASFHGTIIIIWIRFCIPHGRHRWGPASMAEATSKSVEGFVLLIGIVGIVADIVLFCLPFPSIMSLTIHIHKKIGLFITFAVALCLVAASCGSLVYRIIAYKHAIQDPTWVAINVCIASTIEIFGGLCVSCAPGIATFWHNIFFETKTYAWLHIKVTGHPPNTTKDVDSGYVSFAQIDEDLARLKLQDYYDDDCSVKSSPNASSRSSTEHASMKEYGFITHAVAEPPGAKLSSKSDTSG